MALAPLPPSFQKSWLERPAYPKNLVQRTISSHLSALEAYKKRLNEAAPDLFETREDEIEVYVRDLATDDGRGCGLFGESL